MANKKNDLVLSAIALVKIGEAVEAAKDQLRRLVEQGVPYESEEMRKALEEYLSLQQQWNELEAEHLKLKKRIVGS